MFYSERKIVLQEVPGEISICFTITGCELMCVGCHSPHLWKKGSGNKLSPDFFTDMINRYKDYATTVLFMGGEWYKNELIELLKIARRQGYNTCLYTGQTEVDADISIHLTWLKTGPWIRELGGLDSENTNQIFLEIQTNKVLNHLFKKKSHDQIKQRAN